MDKDIFESVMEGAARAYFRAAEGPGGWRLWEDWEPIDNPIIGLAVGDVVFTYDSDTESVVECRVASVHEGIAYYVDHNDEGKPYVWPIDAEGHATSLEGAVELWREQIAEDIRFMERRAERLRALQSVVGDILRK